MTAAVLPIESCGNCGTEFAPEMTVCPGCGRLVHADQLTELAETARAATDRADVPSALAAWRVALSLLPPGSRQHQIISRKITELGSQQSGNSSSSANRSDGGTAPPRSKLAGALGAIALGAWKLKAILFGLSNGTTLLTMMVSLGAYWTIFGWKFALGIVLSIYVHEMGHVIVLRKFGFKASPPMFIPGFGALIRLQQQIDNPAEDAEIGLAGPVYGLGAALFSLTLWAITHQPIFAAIAGLGAWINLFNLLPVWTLDGGRGFHAMSRAQKFLAAATVAGAWYFTGDGLLVLLGFVCLYRAVVNRSGQPGNRKATITYILLVIALAAVSLARFHSGIKTQ